MDGILLIDKPQGFTSFDVVAKLRGITHERKIGHAGTLDPMATGILPLFLGRATRLCDILPDQDKQYTATFELGYTTDTQDATGQVLTRSTVAVETGRVQQVLDSFVGSYDQMPPMYSAVQVGGRRLYDIARAGGEVERTPRPVTIRSIRLLQADEQAHCYTVDVSCSKGTYIRTLCHDIGQVLGCGATLTALRRTRAAGFALQQCITIGEAQQLADAGQLEEHLLPIDSALRSLPRLDLGEWHSRMFSNGVPLSLEKHRFPYLEGSFTVYDARGCFLGLGRMDGPQGALRVDKLFAPRG